MATDLRLTAALLLAALASACTLGPEPKRPDVPVPDGWAGPGTQAFERDLPSHAVQRDADLAHWWATFQDPVLDRLVQQAVAQNLDLQTAALRIASARAQRDATAGKRDPSVEGSAVAGRARMSENGVSQALGGGASGGAAGGSTGSTTGGGADGTDSSAASKPPSTFNLFQAGFDATWELDLFGGVRRGISAADADVRAAEEARRDALVSLTAEIARAWFSLRGARHERDVLLADIATQEQLGKLVASRRRAGLAPDSDVATQRAQAEAVRAQLPPVDERIAQGMNRLTLLLALPPGGLDPIVVAPASLPALPPEVPVGLPGELLRRRPDVRQREAELEAATYRIGVARAKLFPSLRLGATAGLQSTTASSLLDWSSRFFIGGGQLSIPIFQGGQLRAQVRIADLDAQQRALAYRQAVLGAYHDVDNALSAYASVQRRSEALGRQLEADRRSRELAQSRYRSGLAAYIEVLDAERQAHQSEIALSGSDTDASTGLVAVFKSLGGGWSEEASR